MNNLDHIVYALLRTVRDTSQDSEIRHAAALELHRTYFPRPVAYARWSAMRWRFAQRMRERTAPGQHRKEAFSLMMLSNIFELSEIVDRIGPDNCFNLARSRLNKLVTIDLLGAEWWKEKKTISTDGPILDNLTPEAQEILEYLAGKMGPNLAELEAVELLQRANLREREVWTFTAVYRHGWPIQECADVLSLSYGATKQLLYRVREKVKQAA